MSQQYLTARALLQAADVATRDIAYKLGKRLRWELVKVDLLIEDVQKGKGLNINHDALKKSARICIASLDSKHGKRTGYVSKHEHARIHACTEPPSFIYMLLFIHVLVSDHIVLSVALT